MPTGRPPHMLGFSDAVQNVLIYNYANFEGRASRSEYGWFMLFMFLIMMGVTMFVMALFPPEFDADGTPQNEPCLPILLVCLPLLIPFISVSVRRLHDIGISGVWFGFIVTPLINVILVLVLPFIEGEGHPNQYGDVPTNKLGAASVTKTAMDVKLGLSSYDAEKLKDAKELLDRGVITEKEFQKIKDKYLD